MSDPTLCKCCQRLPVAGDCGHCEVCCGCTYALIVDPIPPDCTPDLVTDFIPEGSDPGDET